MSKAQSKSPFLSLPMIIILVAFVISMIVGVLMYSGQGNGQVRERLESLGFYLFAQPRVLSDVPLNNLNGETKPFVDHLQGWRLVNFGYMFCPDVCPINLALLNTMKVEWEQQEATAPLNVMHITFDPERDTPKLLGDYLDYMNPSFYGLTGELADIRRITQQFNMVFIHEEPDENGHYFITHSDSMALVNPEGQYVGLFKSPYNQEKMIQALNILLNNQ